MANRKLLPQSEPRLSGTLSVLLTDSATTATFSNPPDAAELPTYFMIEPDSDDNREKVRAVDVSGSVVTIERGVDNGGVGVEHQANSTYKQTFTAQHWDKVVEALENGWLSEDAGLTITKVDADTLRIAGYDRTAYYPVGRILLINGTVKCKVVAAAYGGGNTDIDISGGTVPTTITSLKLLIGPVENPLVGVNEIPRYGEDAEASDTYAITLSPAPTAYFAGMTVVLKATTANTGACTLNVNELGAKDIKTPDGEDPFDSLITAGSIVTLVYDGTNFIIQSANGLKTYVDNQSWEKDSLLRQAIINGNFDISQRGTSFTSPANGAYTLDRWQISRVNDGAVDIIQTADAPTANESGVLSTNCLHADVTTADASLAANQFHLIQQQIEGVNSKVFGFGQAGTRYVTLSFWVKATKTGIYCVSLANQALNRTYVKEYTVNASDTWEKKTLTFPVDTSGTWLTDTGIGLKVRFALGSGADGQGSADAWAAANYMATANQVNALDSASNNFKLSQVQLCAGDVALPFMPKSFEDELAACQRYFEKSYSDGVNPGAASTLGCSMISTGTNCGAGTYVQLGICFKVTKRSVPSIAYYDMAGTASKVTSIAANTNAVNGVTGAITDIGMNGFTAYMQGNTTSGFRVHWTANAEL